MYKLLFTLCVLVLAFLLSRTGLLQADKFQQEAIKKGMRIVSEPKGKIFILMALGLFLIGIVTFFVWLAYISGDWEKAKVPMLICEGIAVFSAIVLFFLSYCLYRLHILYDEQKILIGKIFGDYQVLRWCDIGEMKIKNQDFFSLYDREGCCCIKAHAGMTGYSEFYLMAYGTLKPEANAGERRQYAGSGTLRYQTGDAYLLLVLGLLMAGMLFIICDDPRILFPLFLQTETGGLWFVPFLLIAGSFRVVYTSFQKITYDRRGLVIRRFLHRTARILWTQIEHVELRTEREKEREIVLYTQDAKYSISESKFRKGFSEFVFELQEKNYV